jgi:6,7-dimethyl-8-ribityllumazine synthase
MKIIEGNLIGKGLKIGIILSRFNNFITNRLLEGCIDALKRHSVEESDIDVYKVYGSFEIPAVARKVVNLKKYDAVICLGAIIRGETPHFDYVAAETSKGIAQVSLDSDIPVIFGIITADTVEQAIDRAGLKDGNKGADAAVAAIEMANLYKSMK